nr:hypothetical protein [Actinomycetota bacterium]
MRKGIALLVAAGITASLAASAHAGAPKIVFEDAAGDVNLNNTVLPAGGSEAGFDILSGEIARIGTDLEFKVTHAAMPPNGTLPEGFRFLWHFQVDGEEYRVTVKSVDVGKPDVIAQSGTERVGKVDAAGHFRLEQCFIEATPAVNLSQCNPVGYYPGAFDPAAATFAFTIPMADLKAKPGSSITGGSGGASGTGCQICWVPQIAERSLTPHTILD